MTHVLIPLSTHLSITFPTPDSVNCMKPGLFLFDNFDGDSWAFTLFTERHSLRLLGVLFPFLLSFRLELGANSRPAGISSDDRGPPSWKRPLRAVLGIVTWRLNH